MGSNGTPRGTIEFAVKERVREEVGYFGLRG